ncbi:hypothetical protein UA38_00750 [Photobacterium kishitanii]|uniref:Uncharacterized protein n=1 Tax=Photobacterium kishitanii TaxID=318456 RepID=A0AAX0Z124_9GAMM|nr:hypothetical protein [Photobacterium kishitanii]KJG10721.1 hypothetical protein UB40_05010 [Photobacterium kishitanii]KJG59734.1 hypothetical protein UA38_00750 [Photobacterium kishitanii]KJG67966.1 hypothetical protein UA40_01720 [Photobacterium kishitanii]PSV08054.1 hypothetical protein C0W96_02020 [Photobacterium kishitanii]PSV16510.1 hypothetical protein C0W59_07415 [Photobacterium kishitanii]
MLNFDFADNKKLRFHQTDQLPVFKGNSELYFMVIDQDSFNIASYDCDVLGMNNLHHFLSRLCEDSGDNVMVLANWKGQYQAHTFVCCRETLQKMLKNALGESFLDELCSGLAY